MGRRPTFRGLHRRPLLVAWAAASALFACAHLDAVVLDGRVDPPFEYVLHVMESRRSPDKGGLDMLMSVTGAGDAYNIALRLPTTLTPEDVESLGAFAVRVYTSAPGPGGMPARLTLLDLPADWPLGRKLELPGGGVPEGGGVRRIPVCRGGELLHVRVCDRPRRPGSPRKE